MDIIQRNIFDKWNTPLKCKEKQQERETWESQESWRDKFFLLPWWRHLEGQDPKSDTEQPGLGQVVTSATHSLTSCFPSPNPGILGDPTPIKDWASLLRSQPEIAGKGAPLIGNGNFIRERLKPLRQVICDWQRESFGAIQIALFCFFPYLPLEIAFHSTISP